MSAVAGENILRSISLRHSPTPRHHQAGRTVVHCASHSAATSSHVSSRPNSGTSGHDTAAKRRCEGRREGGRAAYRSGCAPRERSVGEQEWGGTTRNGARPERPPALPPRLLSNHPPPWVSPRAEDTATESHTWAQKAPTRALRG